eukprot:2754111-Amphidinium_carterae.1
MLGPMKPLNLSGVPVMGTWYTSPPGSVTVRGPSRLRYKFLCASSILGPFAFQSNDDVIAKQFFVVFSLRGHSAELGCPSGM